MNVISLALFRPVVGEHRHDDGHQHFSSFLPAVLRAARVIFPGWEIWIFHDDWLGSCYYGSTLKLLHERGLVRLVYCGPVAAICHAMLWRMIPVVEGTADRVLCRDLDSLPTPRERWAVEDWIASGKTMHVIHDHANHANPGSPMFIPGGLCGFDSARFRTKTGITNLRQMLAWGQAHGISFRAKGDDQTVLNGMLPPFLSDDACFHPYDPTTNHAAVTPRDLPGLPLELAAPANRLCDYIGGVFNVPAAIAFYHPFPQAQCIEAAERTVGENPVAGT